MRVTRPAAVPACAVALTVSSLILGCSGDAERVAHETSASAPTTVLEHPVRIEADGWSSSTIPYRCADGTVLEVAYLNVKDGDSFAALSFGGGTHLLQSRVIASGAAYIALDEQRSYRWRTKGDSGFLAFLPADDHAREETVLRDCGPP